MGSLTKPHRKSIRLKEYDYSQQGMYFITICVKNKDYLFGEIIDDEMKLNDAGTMVNIQWIELANRFNNIFFDEYIVMPNHFHGIIGIDAPARRAPTRGAPTQAIGDIIGAFKSLTTCEYGKGVKNKAWREFNQKLWQRNYYEHIIRNETSLSEVREYIIYNPMIWHLDELNQLNSKLATS